MEATQIQTVEQFLFEQLQKIAPGKYTLASALQRIEHTLRFPCTHLKGGRIKHTLRFPRTHLKGGRVNVPGLNKDYNFSVFTFSDGVTEIKCLYNCGLKIRSNNAEQVDLFNELYEIALNQSSNTKATSEQPVQRVVNGERVPLDPGPVPIYTDADRQRIKDSNEAFLRTIERRIEPGLPVLFSGTTNHPDPIEAPDTTIERGIKQAFVKAKLKKVIKATAVVQDKIPAPKKKKIRKTQSRKRGK